jgi:hypothetical protein
MYILGIINWLNTNGNDDDENIISICDKYAPKVIKKIDIMRDAWIFQ